MTMDLIILAAEKPDRLHVEEWVDKEPVAES